MSPRWTLSGLRWSYCAFIAAASSIAMHSAMQDTAKVRMVRR